MERKLAEKTSDYIDNFKLSIKKWIEENDNISMNTKSEFLQFIYDFDGLTFTKEDFTKRKRVKSLVPQYLRCRAKRANGEQCTRKKKDDNLYCGTHDKNRPHGEICSECEEEIKKVEVFLQDINGILYYIDNFGNIYNTQDVVNNKTNPDVYARYIFENGKYNIIV